MFDKWIKFYARSIVQSWEPRYDATHVHCRLNKAQARDLLYSIVNEFGKDTVDRWIALQPLHKTKT